MIEETLCPICKSKMKPAVSTHGKYWKCTRWGCNGTRDVNGQSKVERSNERDERDV